MVCPACGGSLDRPGHVGPDSGGRIPQPVPPAPSTSDDPPPSGAAGLVIRVLSGLVVLLCAAIALVLGAEMLRHLLTRPDVPPRPDTLQEWIRRLEEGPDQQARQEAAWAVVAQGPGAVAEALDATTAIPSDESMLDISPPVIAALAGVGPEAAGPLGAALSSEKENVRAAAAAVLRKLGPHAKPALKPLAAAVGDENRWVRWYAVEALGNLGPDAAPAVDALLPLVEHVDRRTRFKAVVALGRIGPASKAAVPKLRQAAQRDEYRAIREAATVALYQVNLEEIAAQAAAQAPEEIRALLDRLRSNDEHQSVSAANELGRLGARAAPAVPALALALRADQKWVRVAAAEALGAMDREARHVVPLLEQAAEDEDLDVRQAAAEALAEIQGRPLP